jgi:hypothetical protein
MYEAHRVHVEQRHTQLLREAKAGRRRTGYAFKRKSRVTRAPARQLASVSAAGLSYYWSGFEALDTVRAVHVLEFVHKEQEPADVER